MVKESKTNQGFDLNKLAEAQKGICESVVGHLNNQNTPKTQEDRARFFQQETPIFGQSSEDLAKTLTDAGIKAAKATHEFNMKEIKAKLIAALCKELVKTPIRYEDVPQIAREIADKALENL